MIVSTIFLSSTWEDLKEHRKIVIEDLTRLKLNIEGMEFFGASPEIPMEESLKRVQSSDIFVGILGTRYGTIDPSTMKSITELEYIKAQECNKPIFMYLIDEDNHPVLPRYIEKGDGAIALDNFKEIVKREHLIQKFKSPENLSRKMTSDLMEFFYGRGNYFEDISKNKFNQIDSNKQISLPLSGFSFLNSNGNVNFDSLFSIKDDDSKQLKDEVIETAMTAGFFVSQLKNGNYDILQGVISFQPDVLRVLLGLLNKNEIDQDSLSNAILFCNNSVTIQPVSNFAQLI